MRALTLLLFFWIPWSGLGCIAATPTPKANRVLSTSSFAGLQSECLPEFPDHDGWYGADAAYSVPLPIDDGRVSLWLFGDSFVQHPGMHSGRTYPFVHNTIGLSRCDSGGAWSLDTYWRQDEQNVPHAFFVPDPDAKWVRGAIRETGTLPYYWLFGGFVTHDVLFVGLLRVVHSEPRGPFNLPFRLLGIDLARIENFGDAPKDWRVQISILSNDTSAFPASAFVVTPSHLHAFAFFDRGDGRTPRMLSRLSLEALVDWRPDLSDALEYLASDSQWKAGFEPAEAKVVMDDDASEMSVHFDPVIKMWIAVYSDPARNSHIDGTRTPTVIRIRTAHALAGPWSKPRKLISIPETISDRSRSVDESLFCYAAKAHPQFSASSELVVTYVCNLFASNAAEIPTILRKLQKSVDLYRPRAITVGIPSTLESNSARD